MASSTALQTVLAHFGIVAPAPRDVVFLTGAGISAPSPTDYPLGSELHELLLSAFTDLDRADVATASSGIPFEVTCQIMGDTFSKSTLSLSVDVFWNLVSQLFIFDDRWMQSNDLHAYFRSHLRAGGTHLTANIDQFLELDELSHLVRTTRGFDAGDLIDQFNPTLYKFHGDCNRDFIGEQGFQFNAIARGFSPIVQKVWDDLLSKASLVVFCGYGGVDQFDVVPYFAAKPAMSINCSALWLQHADQVPVQMGSVGHMPADMMLSKFRLSSVIKGLAGFVLNELLPTMPQIAQMRRIGGYRNEVRQLVQQSVALYAASSKDFDLLKQAAGAAIRIILRPPSYSSTP
jgi:hypothetical protein